MTVADESAPARDGPKLDFSKVLVVSRSPINRIVVSRIIEQSGLKAIAESPETAPAALTGVIPGTVVLDGGPENSDCNAVLSDVAAIRGMIRRSAPCVIFLSNRSGTAEGLALPRTVDFVVAKPITPDRLHQIIEKLKSGSRQPR
ncbi:response regulator [Mesorhizobium loti]|nr:response regulator [Mesorhizobium loti]PLP59244.1 response regulator [Mesorhizobium loti]